MIVLDANVLIALLDRRDALHGQAFELVEEHAWDVFCTSSVTFAETLVRPSKLGLALATFDRRPGKLARRHGVDLAEVLDQV